MSLAIDILNDMIQECADRAIALSAEPDLERLGGLLGLNVRLNILIEVKRAVQKAEVRKLEEELEAERQRNVWTIKGGQKIANVHPQASCEGEACCVHNPSDHHMAEWSQYFRDPFIWRPPHGRPGRMDRICPHGHYHPDPDHIDWYARTYGPLLAAEEGQHKCDGCCIPPPQCHCAPDQAVCAVCRAV